MKKRIVSLFMALVMALSLVPTGVWAAGEGESGSGLGSVRVIVENNTFTEPYAYEGDDPVAPAWTGVIVDMEVDITADTTMMSAIQTALATKGIEAVGADDGYISKITKESEGKSLGELDGGAGSGWMGTLNDWFTDRGFAEYGLVDGDEIRVMYTCDLGADIDGDFTTMNNTALKTLSFSPGKLLPEFTTDQKEYILSLPEGTTAITVTAAAANKQNQVYLSVGNTSYRRTAEIPVVNGMELTIRCGDAAEATGGEYPTPEVVPTIYTVTVEVAGSKPAVTTADVTIRSQMLGGYLHGFAEPVEVSSDLAEGYGFTDEIESGVSALDALVKAHEITLGEGFTKAAAGDYLVVNKDGFVTKLFGAETSNNGFAVNQGAPNDGTKNDYGYNGTKVTTTRINDGDVLDFFVYQDSKALDSYTWISVPEAAKAGEDFTTTVTGIAYGWYGLSYETPAKLKAAAKALEGVQLAWVDPSTGTCTEIKGAVTDEKGEATFKVTDQDDGKYLVAVGTDDSDTPVIMNPSVQVNVAEAGSLSVTFSGVHNAQVASLKVYTYTDGKKGNRNLLANMTAANGAYTVNLPVGGYWVEGYDEKGDCNGGVSVTVDATHTEFKIQRIYGISVSPSSWKLGEDYTLEVKVTSANNQVRTVVLGEANNWGTMKPSCIFVLGDTVEATATPDAAKHPKNNPGTAKKTPAMNDSLSLSCSDFVTVKFKVPKGSAITFGTLTKYFVYSYMDAVESDAEKGTATYHVNKNTDYFYRVQNPNGVTYWNYAKWTADAEVVLTDEDLYIGSSDFNKSTIYRFENNVYDRADIYLNINTQGYKNMAVGETFELNSFRNWFAIESFMNAKVALPDMHYQVIDVNGKPSDVLTITPDEKNSNVATMTAKKEGTAIVLVTYDAMTHMAGQSSTVSKQFSAIWPECTGVFIVTVGSDGTGIQTNMTLDRMDATITKGEQYALDAEHDILFYLGREGAEYSFKPESGTTVTVARSTVTDKMTFNGFTSDGVTVAGDGTVTVTGLTTGRHIVKVEKGGKANYQVITARGVSYTLVDKDSKELSEEAKAALKAGDTVYLQFKNLVSPKEKLSGAYNFNFSLYYEGEDGTFFKSDPGSNFGVYDFSGNPARQKIKITIPKYWGSDTYTLTGAIKQGGNVGVSTHRGITYAKGTDPGFNAPSVSGILSRLPEVTFYLAKSEFITGTLTFKDSDGVAIDRKNLTITMTDSDGNAVAVNEDGTFKAVAETYTYVITGAGVEYATGSVTVTKDDENKFEIQLVTTSGTTWDGTSQTEPAKNEAGVYQIGTGAELAWFVNASQKSAVSGVLTGDIDLGKYPWLNISSSYKVELDGQNHEITGLNAKSGLFGQIGANSRIQNLTLRGTISGSGSAGAVAGYACGNGIVIESCFSYVTINSTGNNVGGIVGYTYNKATIRNCASFGAVTGGSSVGGIIGGFVGNGNIVTGCYNTGKVTATGSKAGGVFGGSGYGVAVANCYNTGEVTASSVAGGIGGEAKGFVSWSGTVQAVMTVSNCYTTGTSKAFGSVHAVSAEISECYSLSTDDENAEVLVKDAELDMSAFGLVCNGYPALKWQRDVTFHETGAESTVTAPTCTEKGYTTHTCTKCKESYKDTYTAALGHDWCTHTDNDTNCGDCTYTAPDCTKDGSITRTCKRNGCSETKVDVVPALGHTPGSNEVTEYPAYRTYTCDRCKASVKEWNDERLQYVTLPETGVTSASVSDSTYPWGYNTAKDRFESTNVDVDRSTSETAFAFTLSAPTVLTFDYGVSSESSCDKFTAVLSDGTNTKTLVNGISGENSGSCSAWMSAGTWTVTLRYVKDAGAKGGEDMACVSNVKLTGTTAPASDAANIYKNTGDYLAGLGTPGTGSIGGEWMALGLARSGRDVPNVDTYYQTVENYVKTHIAATGRLDRNKSTENSRIILALTAIGKDVTDVGGHDLLKGLDNMNYIKRQGTNGPVWALLALDSHKYPTSGDVTRDALVSTIVGLQMESGAWYIGSSKPTADVDMTAMAVQALAPYYSTNASAKAAVDKALEYLSSVQKADGTFCEYGNQAASSESTAQVVVMLIALGIDPVTDARFTKGGVSVLDALCSFYVDGGGFKHKLADTTRDGMSTEQGYYALAAYYRMKNEKTFLYDMTDVCITHTFGEWITVKAATCTEAGSEKRVCSVCGTEETRTIAALGHKFGAWTVTTSATCTESGVETRTCSVCSTSETRTVAALGHTPGTVVYMDKDYHWQICTVCKAEVNKTAHTYVGGAQCVCGAVKSEDDTLKRIEVSDTIEVPDTLKDNEKLNSQDKIRAELQLQITKKDSKNTEENTAVFDVQMMIITTVNGEQVKTPATKADLVKGKITVLLPYPEAITADYSKYSFTVAHLVTMADCGKDVGTVEFPAVAKTPNGLLVTLTGLSPVAISWMGTSNRYYYNSATTAPDKTDSARTADDSQMVLWLGSAVMAAAAAVVLTRKQKRAGK